MTSLAIGSRTTSCRQVSYPAYFIVLRMRCFAISQYALFFSNPITRRYLGNDQTPYLGEGETP